MTTTSLSSSKKIPGIWFAFRIPNSLIVFDPVWIDVEIRSLLVDTLINDSTIVIFSQQTIDRG